MKIMRPDLVPKGNCNWRRRKGVIKFEKCHHEAAIFACIEPERSDGQFLVEFSVSKFWW